MARTSRDEIRYGIFAEVNSNGFANKFQKMRDLYPALSCFPDAIAFIRFMQDDGDTDWDMKNNALFDLVIAARFSRPYGAAAQTILIASLWPGLDRISRQVEPAPESIQDSFAEVYYAVLQEIQSWDMNKRDKIAVNILMDAKKRVMKMYGAVRDNDIVSFAARDNNEEDIDAGVFNGGADEIVDSVTVEELVVEKYRANILGRFVAGNVISPRESTIIMLHVFEGRDLVEIADFNGVNYKTLCRGYERAIQRLRKFLGNEQAGRIYLDLPL